MKFPIPADRAMQCVNDLAADLRAMSRALLPLQEAAERGEASREELAKLEEGKEAMRAQAEIIICSVDAGGNTIEEFRVGDYATTGTMIRAAFKREQIAAGYRRFLRSLH